MPYIKINQDRLTKEAAAALIEVCPFNALTYDGGKLEIGAGCRMCRLCVKNGPEGVMEYVDEEPEVDKSGWRGIAVYAEQDHGELHNVTLELIGKARELAGQIGQPVYAVMTGSNIRGCAEKLLRYGVNRVFLYDEPELEDFRIDVYANAFSDFIEKVKPAAILVGATNLGRTLAPRVAARWRTGLTADCTSLKIKDNSDVVQIRPAFGGNIMAQIVTPKNRPQLSTVRYKVFSAPKPEAGASGEIVRMELDREKLRSVIDVLEIKHKPRETDISEAEVVVAVGRGLKAPADISMAEELAELLGGVVACTRPLAESGWLDPKRQIGLSGRTVKAKLIVTIGVSGSVQFAAGMKGSECIVAVNNDENASIFDVAHYGFVGDLYEIVPRLISRIKEGNGLGL